MKTVYQRRQPNLSCLMKRVSFWAVVILAVAICPGNAEVEFDNKPIAAVQTELPVYKWRDSESRPRAVVLMIHGISQRACTLKKVAEEMASNGFLTYGLDLRGHGWWHDKDKRSKKDPGFSSDYRGSLDDALHLANHLKRTNSHLPLVIVGESVGAAVALRTAAKLGDAIDGLVLCGAGNKVCSTSKRWLCADLLRGALGRQIDIVRYQRKFGTDDLRALEETIADPLQRKKFSMRELLRARSFLGKNRKFAKQLDPMTSVLIVQGAEDKTLTTRSARKVFEAVPGENKRLVVVPSCGHILLGTGYPKKLVTQSMVSFVDEAAAQQVAGLEKETFQN